ncbi:MAG: F0F1 ATP synthase subunit alpha [Chloroflexi bacterium]|nr:F0F1 ATP synthase subunit alpha [Chloroflexota bacterium]
MDGGVEIDRASLVQTISDRAAESLVPGRSQFSLPDVLNALDQQIDHIKSVVRFQDVGTVQHIGEGVATISGLPNAGTDELVDFPTGVQGLILNLDRGLCDVILLGSDEGIQGGDLVTSTGERVRVPVGQGLLGQVLDPLGRRLMGTGPINASEYRFLERSAPGIITRTPVNEPLHTGSKTIDALVPIGRGQRELIVGDRQTGKTTLAVDAILSQRHTEVACVYVAIGQKKSSSLAVIETLQKAGALSYTIVVVSSPDDPPALRYIAPYAGCTMAEYLVDNGQDVLIVYDDLSKHADAYRELSLLLRRPPGREAYPGDIFYLHARLLERACKLNAEAGGGSLTALPIVETQRGNISSYIPTNLISITDGQIVLDADLFNQGIKPAVDTGRSVSRVGGAAQTSAMRSVVRDLRLELSQYEEVARFARFGTEVDDATQRQIQRGERLRAVLTQPPHQPYDLSAELIVLIAATEGFLDHVPLDQLPDFERELLQHMAGDHPGMIQQLDRTGELTKDTRHIIIDAIDDFAKHWGVQSKSIEP